MNKKDAHNLLIKPRSREHIKKILESIEKSPKHIITLSLKGFKKIINKIIAYEYIINGSIVNVGTVGLLRQDVDGVWVCYSTNKSAELIYAKVWFYGPNPEDFLKLNSNFFEKESIDDNKRKN